MDWTQRVRLRNLQMLVDLSTTQNISHTASALHSSQPALSKWLKELEEDVGMTLFERHARGLRPTPQGLVLIEHARRVLAQLDMARDEMAVLREGGSGLLRIGTSGASAADTVPLAVIDLLAQAPQTRVHLFEGTMDRLLEQLARGELDIVVGRSMPEPIDAGLRAEALYVEPIHLVARPSHPLAGRTDLQWNDLLAYRWLMWPRGTPIRTALEDALAQAGQQMPEDCVESNSVTLNLTLLNHSDMIGVASHRAALRFSQLNAMRVIDMPLFVFGSVSVYWHMRNEARPVVAHCIRCIGETAARTGAESSPDRASFRGPAVYLMADSCPLTNVTKR